MSTEENDIETKDQTNKERAKATGDLDKVTEHVEEREMDSKNMADSVRAMLGSTPSARKKDDASLMNVKIQQSDVDIIVEEMDMTPKDAERALRKAHGDVVKALCDLVD